MTIKNDVLNALLKLREEGPPDRGFGICGNLETLLKNHTYEDIIKVVEPYFTRWPHFKDIRFPVEGTLSDYQRYVDKWHGNPYADRRWNLLDFLIDEITADLIDADFEVNPLDLDNLPGTWDRSDL